MARSTVGLVLRWLGLNRLALLQPKLPVVRYEQHRPGEMIHMDIKKLGKINGVGHRFLPRGPGMHTNKATAGTSCTSPSMTPPVWPIPRSCRPKAGQTRPTFSIDP